MLIKSGYLYKMLYILNLSNQSLRLACNLEQELLSPMAGNKDIYKILGNWANKNSNSWKLGFFEDFAIHKGEFWDYKTLEFNGSSANIVLTKGTAWKNIIKENKLSGENVVHYRLPDDQQGMIERRLSIRSFPTYILMDKKGNIVNMNAPRPQEKDQLVNEITKLL